MAPHIGQPVAATQDDSEADFSPGEGTGSLNSGVALGAHSHVFTQQTGTGDCVGKSLQKTFPVKQLPAAHLPGILAGDGVLTRGVFPSPFDLAVAGSFWHLSRVSPMHKVIVLSNIC